MFYNKVKFQCKYGIFIGFFFQPFFNSFAESYTWDGSKLTDQAIEWIVPGKWYAPQHKAGPTGNVYVFSPEIAEDSIMTVNIVYSKGDWEKDDIWDSLQSHTELFQHSRLILGEEFVSSNGYYSGVRSYEYLDTGYHNTLLVIVGVNPEDSFDSIMAFIRMSGKGDVSLDEVKAYANGLSFYSIPGAFNDALNLADLPEYWKVSSASGLEMIRVDSGKFLMGKKSDNSESESFKEEIRKEVIIEKGFYLGKFEVTQLQYETVMKGNTKGLNAKPSRWLNNNERPVEQVSWNDVQIFLSRLNLMEKSQGYIPEGWEYTLPTEAQWEYACRAGTSSIYSWGDEADFTKANYGYVLNETIKVGSFKPNNWGFYDMHGNVAEFCADSFGHGYPKEEVVVKGGSFDTGEYSTHSASRSSINSSYRSSERGFRIALENKVQQTFAELVDIVFSFEDTGSNWFFSPWFGYSYFPKFLVPEGAGFEIPIISLALMGNQEFRFPWIYHETLGWLYIHINQDNSIWMYSDFAEVWYWTNSSLFPFLYLQPHILSEAWITPGWRFLDNKMKQIKAYSLSSENSWSDQSLLLPNGNQSISDPLSIDEEVDSINEETEQTNFPFDVTNPPAIWEVPSASNLEMIWVEPGTFIMGSPPDEIGRYPSENQIQIEIERGYFLGKYEVTQEEYRVIMKENTNGLEPSPSIFSGYPNRPVENVSWDDTQIFLNLLNLSETMNMPKGWSYSLPNEAQWEYACRAGTITAYHWGQNLSQSNANYFSNEIYNPITSMHHETTLVGQFPPNNWGFYDMAGNVPEWCMDNAGGQSKVLRYGPRSAESGGDWKSNGKSDVLTYGFRICFQQSQ